MKDANFWVNLLFNFGPFALLVFFAFVTVRMSAAKLKQYPDSTLHRRIYVANWIAVFVLGVVVTTYWLYTHGKQRAILRGTIQNLPSQYAVSNDLSQDGIDLYTFKLYSDRGRGIIQYRWAVLSEHRLNDGDTIPIVISMPDPSSGDKEVGRELKLKVKGSYYDTPVTILYHQKQDKFTLEQGSAETEVESVDLAADLRNARPGPVPKTLFPIVYAASQLDAAGMTARLESPDPIIRRDARKDLADFNRDALSYINAVLSNPKSSYRLRLGVLVAMNQMPDKNIGDSLSVESLVTALRGIGSSDDAYRNEARKFVQQKGSWEMEGKLSQALASDKNGDVAWKTQLALADMDVLYNLGIREKDLYGGNRDNSHLRAATGAFEKGWNDRTYASQSARVYFAKALYGWALTLADQSVLDVDAAGRRKPELIRAAQDKFREFLAATETRPGSTPYPGSDQIITANKYLQNPTLGS